MKSIGISSAFKMEIIVVKPVFPGIWEMFQHFIRFTSNLQGMVIANAIVVKCCKIAVL